MVLGVALVAQGCIALGSLRMAKLATALAIGALLVVSGVAEVLGAISSWRWSGLFYHPLSGVL